MTTIDQIQLQSMLESAVSIAVIAGERLRHAYQQPPQIELKGDVDLVTQADREAEAIIIEALTDRFPHHAIHAEESGPQGSDSDLCWLVDPLDGTTNFAHKFPVFAVSIALWQGNEPLLGVIYDPLRDECFVAARGQGMRINGKPVSVTAADTLKASLLATGFPYNRHVAQENNAEAFAVLIRQAQGVRRAGAAALDLAYVACGRLDGYWEKDLHPWDGAAGILLVREAGGRVTDYAGRDTSDALRQGQQIVASNGHIHAAMLKTLDSIYK